MSGKKTFITTISGAGYAIIVMLNMLFYGFSSIKLRRKKNVVA